MPWTPDGDTGPKCVLIVLFPLCFLIPGPSGFYVLTAIAYGVSPALLALCVYGLLQRWTSGKGVESGETRCRKCGYILRGISEPRCPECGERI